MAEGEAITGQEGKVVEETATAGADGGILHPPTGRVWKGFQRVAEEEECWPKETTILWEAEKQAVQTAGSQDKEG